MSQGSRGEITAPGIHCLSDSPLESSRGIKNACLRFLGERLLLLAIIACQALNVRVIRAASTGGSKGVHFMVLGDTLLLPTIIVCQVLRRSDAIQHIDCRTFLSANLILICIRTLS